MLRVIAIDGPAASGKSSTAGLVAQRLGWAHLDSGALYRALTLAAVDNLDEAARRPDGAWPAQRILDLAERLPVRLVLIGSTFRPEVAGASVEEAIRSERVTRHVSVVAAIPEVRTWVNTQQRRAVEGGQGRGVVVDGRDIGTVVFPDAIVKIYLTAGPAERVQRRYKQLKEKGFDVNLAQLSVEITERDTRDSQRVISPLRPADDAAVIDTTNLTPADVFRRVSMLVSQRLPGCPEQNGALNIQL